ncbi:hypothetical protein ABTX81_01380 [Kitasatospora sp. NPDC097605]|uniref:hypothetical protein n=1 Tax=Kitasatospora sp. NPDC097605 TaxID=3157226 RepID=UPI0033344B73
MGRARSGRRAAGGVPEALHEHIDSTMMVTLATSQYESHARRERYHYKGGMVQPLSKAPASTAPIPYPAAAWYWNI